jgi:DNA polymerase III delta subunit
MAGRASSGPWGGAVLRTVLADVARGWPPGLVVLTGEDLFHLDAAQRALLKHLAPEGVGDLALTVFGERKTDAGSVVSAACSAGMFSPRRVVLVRDVEALEGKAGPIGDYAAAPPPDSFLIVRAPRLDARRVLHRELLEAGRVLAFRSAGGSEETKALMREAAELARERGLALAPDAIEFVVEVSAGDLHRVSSEMDKIRDWRGRESRGTVTLRDAREVAVGGGTLSGWELADAVLLRDPVEALVATRRLAEAGEPVLRTLGGLAWRLRGMLEVKASIGGGARPEDAAQSVWTGVSAKRLLAGLGRWPLGDLLALPGRLLRADRTLKSRGIDPRAVLESLADDLTRGGARPGREGR